MPTTTPLSDADLDRLLAGAALRLVHVTTAVALGAPPAPSSDHRTVLTAVAAVTIASAGIATVVATSRSAPATLPPGFREGAYGTEIRMVEVDDGDGSTDTALLRARPAGGDVTITRGAPAGARTATTAAGSAGTGVPDRTPTELCVESANVGGACGSEESLAQPMLQTGPRGADGGALVTGVPGDVVAVAFSAGTDRHWARPNRGVALFPYPADATPDSLAVLVRADGTEVARLVSRDSTLTDAEVASRAVTAPSGSVLPTVWLARATDALPGRMGGWIRSTGRPTATGFAGAFAAQGFALAGTGLHDAWIVTVRTDQASLAAERIGRSGLPGSIRRTIDEGDGTTVLAWAETSVPDASVDALIATLGSSARPFGDEVIDLTAPWAWTGQRTGPQGLLTVPTALFGRPVGSVDVDGTPETLWAIADDLGAIRFQSVRNGDGGSTASGDVQPGEVPTLPTPGQRLFRGQLLTVPASTTAVTITLDDGTVLTPALVDVRPTADAKLLVVPTSADRSTIRSISGR